MIGKASFRFAMVLEKSYICTRLRNIVCRGGLIRVFQCCVFVHVCLINQTNNKTAPVGLFHFACSFVYPIGDFSVYSVVVCLLFNQS